MKHEIPEYIQESFIKALSPREIELFTFLKDVNTRLKLNVTMRVAGGWVRDKILYLQPMPDADADIDIALDGMTGEQFATHLNKYYQTYQDWHGTPHPAMGKSYVIKANPEKSKLLETVTIQIYSYKVDFVNLREESYSEDSRIPTMKMATGPDAASKDAHRRDLTINAIFFNINTSEIEDFVGGVRDIRSPYGAMMLRTPTDPKKTFLEDPLRMLRVFRFLSTKSAILHSSIFEALCDYSVQIGYHKVAPERAAPELIKMLEGINAAYAIRRLFFTGLYDVIFGYKDIKKNGLPIVDSARYYLAGPYKVLMLLAALLYALRRDEIEKFLISIGMGKNTRIVVTQILSLQDILEGQIYANKTYLSVPLQPTELQLAKGTIKEVITNPKNHHYIKNLHRIIKSIKPANASEDYTDGYPPGGCLKQDIFNLALHFCEHITPRDDRFLLNLAIAKEYSSIWSSLMATPNIDGNEIMLMFPNLPLNKSNLQGQNFISKIKDEILERKAVGELQTIEEIRNYVDSIKEDIKKEFGEPEKIKILEV